MSSEVSLRLWYHIQSTKTEIGGMGYANFNNDGDLLWSKVFLCPQIVSLSEVDFEETGGDAFAIEKAVNDGVLNDPTFVWVSWHSHCTLNTFWSKTDDDRIAALRKAGIQHVVSFVGNHERKYRVRFDAFDIDRGPYSIPHVIMDDLKVYLDSSEDIFLDCESEYERCVQVRRYQTSPVVRSVVPPHMQSGWLSEAEAAEAASGSLMVTEDDVIRYTS